MQPNSNIDGLPGTTRSLQSQGLASGLERSDSASQPKGMHLSQRIKRLLRVLFRRFPGVVQFARVGLWYLSSYFPRLVTSRLFRRVPRYPLLRGCVNLASPCSATSESERRGSD
jgi:hypothetical protein